LAVLAIIAWQSVEVSESFTRFWISPLWILSYLAWPALFCLAGFALAGDETRPRRLFARLFIRGVGPFILTVLGAAFLLGPLVTVLAMGSYFADRDLWIYLLNIVGIPQFTLPGVFEFNNLTRVVNQPLWAVPAFVATFIVACSARLVRRRRALAGAVAAIVLALGVADWLGQLELPGTLTGTALAATLAGQIGILVFEYRERFTVGRLLFVSTLAAMAAMAYLGRGRSWTDPLPLQVFAAIASVAVVGAFRVRLPLGRLSLALEPFLGASLLAAFPLQQLVASSRMAPQDALSNFLIAAPLIGAASFALVWLSAKVAPILGLSGGEDIRISMPAALHPATSQRRGWRRFSPLILLFSVLILVSLGVLAMTLFALQRNPWEN
jgi:hypothetical protein